MQGAALDEVLAFFPAVLASGSSAVTFDSMLSSLLAAGNAQDTSKTAQRNIARCIASLTAPTSQEQVNAVVKGLLTQLQVSALLSLLRTVPRRFSRDVGSGRNCEILRTPHMLLVLNMSRHKVTRVSACADWQWLLGSTGREQRAQEGCKPGGLPLGLTLICCC